MLLFMRFGPDFAMIELIAAETALRAGQSQSSRRRYCCNGVAMQSNMTEVAYDINY